MALGKLCDAIRGLILIRLQWTVTAFLLLCSTFLILDCVVTLFLLADPLYTLGNIIIHAYKQRWRRGIYEVE